MEKFAGVSQKLANLQVTFQLVKLLDLYLKKQTKPIKGGFLLFSIHLYGQQYKRISKLTLLPDASSSKTVKSWPVIECINNKFHKVTWGGVLWNIALSTLLYPGNRRNTHRKNTDFFTLPFKSPSLASNEFILRISKKWVILPNNIKYWINFFEKTYKPSAIGGMTFHTISFILQYPGLYRTPAYCRYITAKI